MKKWALTMAVSAGLLGLTACSSGDDSEAVMTSSAGDITKDELYEAMKEKYGDQVLQELVYSKVLSEKYEISDKDLDAKVEDIKTQLGENFEAALVNAGYADEAALRKSLKVGMLQEKAALSNVEVTEDELKTYYKESVKPEIKARHILVADEETAKKVKVKLDADEDFAALAKEYSTDTTTAKDGGNLGWFGSGEQSAEVEKAAYALKKGEISEPIKAEDGYHIIQLQDQKEKESYKELKAEIETAVKTAKLDNATVATILDKELEDAKVKIKDKDLKEALTTDTKTAE